MAARVPLPFTIGLRPPHFMVLPEGRSAVKYRTILDILHA
jgi:hypothetical protein